MRAFFEANLALTQPQPPFNLFDPHAPIYTHARYLPPSKITRCTIDQVVFGEGCLVTDAHLTRCILWEPLPDRAHADLEDVVMLGANFYQSEAEIAADVAQGRPPLGVGRQGRLHRAIIDKNARIGAGVALSPEGNRTGSTRMAS